MFRVLRIFSYSCFVCSVTALAVFCRSQMAANRSPVTHPSPTDESFQSLGDILSYISRDWDRLTRSVDNCETFVDTKTSGEPVLYLPSTVRLPPALEEMQKRCAVRIARLPEDLHISSGDMPVQFKDQGLLYLENPYVVPGGQFNEMYGWDSYFIIRGLLQDGRRDLAKGMVENFFYEIEHYGGILNANRT